MPARLARTSSRAAVSSCRAIRRNRAAIRGTVRTVGTSMRWEAFEVMAAGCGAVGVGATGNVRSAARSGPLTYRVGSDSIDCDPRAGHDATVDALRSRGMWELPGSISLPREPGGLVLCLAGEVDAAVVWDFETRHGPPEPVDAIDAGAVMFICAHGVGLMADWARVSAAAGHRAVLRRSTPLIDRVLQLTALDGELLREASASG